MVVIRRGATTVHAGFYFVPFYGPVVLALVVGRGVWRVALFILEDQVTK